MIVIFMGVIMTVSSALTGPLSSATPFVLIAAAITLFGSAATGQNGVMFARAAQLAPEGQVGGERKRVPNANNFDGGCQSHIA